MLNRITHTFIHVLDQDEALDFYVGKLGMVVTNDADLGFMRWLTVSPKDQSDFELVLMAPGPPVYDDKTVEQIRELVAKGAAGGGVIFQTDDCRATCEKLRAAGVEITQEPTERFYGTDCGIRDPFGNAFRITQPAEGPIEVPSAEEFMASELGASAAGRDRLAGHPLRRSSALGCHGPREVPEPRRLAPTPVVAVRQTQLRFERHSREPVLATAAIRSSLSTTRRGSRATIETAITRQRAPGRSGAGECATSQNWAQISEPISAKQACAALSDLALSVSGRSDRLASVWRRARRVEPSTRPVGRSLRIHVPIRHIPPHRRAVGSYIDELWRPSGLRCRRQITLAFATSTAPRSRLRSLSFSASASLLRSPARQRSTITLRSRTPSGLSPAARMTAMISPTVGGSGG